MRFILASFVGVLGFSASVASAQMCDPTPGGGWHPGGTTPGCVPLIATFGGPAGFGTNVLPGNDDGSTDTLDLTPAFPGGLSFFGGPYTTVVINNNGNVTFGGALFTYTPEPFPLAGGDGTDFPMIAPYWADIDTRACDPTWGECTGPTPAPNHNLVYWNMSPGQLVVTWFDTGYYDTHYDRRMSFQMIIRNALDCGSGDFDVEFRYNQCEWTTGDASEGTGGFGGTPAQVGFDAHNGMDYVSIPESLTMAVVNVCTTSNVGMPGIYQFSVRGGEVVCPGSGEPCEVPGLIGACGVGRTQCIGRGMVECQAIGMPRSERCDGIDNDCNGETDEGDLCTGDLEVCSMGRCVGPCFEGGCGDGFTCTETGSCVETACIGVTCPIGQRCLGGTCVDACGGVTCPHGQQCVFGTCTNLCDLIECGEGQICEDGACVPTCPCHTCPDTHSCGADGRCNPIGCDLTVCDPGFYCELGACLDACAGAVCPEGQHCTVGTCVDDSIPTVDAGVPPGTDAGPRGDGGGGGGGGGGGRGAGGCGCTVESGPAPGWAAFLVLGLGAVAAARRRRR
jgi:MYXO-CTERM domain-containing protein